MNTWIKSAKSLASTTALACAVFSAPVLLDRNASLVGVQIDLGASVEAAEQEKVTRRLPGISEKVFKLLGKVSEEVNPDTDKDPNAEPDLDKAYKLLQNAEKRCEDCNPYEKSQIYNMFAYVAYALEKPTEAIGYYKKVISYSPQIPLGVELASIKYVAQLAFQEENYNEAISYMEKHAKLSTENGIDVPADMYQLKSVICFQGGKSKCAMDSITTAIDIVEARDKVAEESWYNLKRSLYLDKEDYKNATALLELMIRHYPKKSYWSQLGSMYGMLEREKDQLQAMDTAYRMGAFSKERDLINLSYLYIAEDVPYFAGKILSDAMDKKLVARTEKNLDTLSIAWQNAKESQKSIEVLKEIAKISKSGNAYGYLAAAYINLDRPRDAISAANKALKVGNFTRGMDGQTLISQGTGYFDTRQYSKAIDSFAKAAKIKKYAKFANGWLRYAKNEKARYDGLKSALKGLGLDIEKVLN